MHRSFFTQAIKFISVESFYPENAIIDVGGRFLQILEAVNLSGEKFVTQGAITDEADLAAGIERLVFGIA